jgi:putative endonuclease
MKFLYVYILKCSDRTYYTGVTNDPEVRLADHNTGINTKAYTYSRRPVEIVYSEKFNDYIEAIEWEKKIKKWSRKKKEALIAGNYGSLHELAECKNESHYTNNSHASTPLSMTNNT